MSMTSHCGRLGIILVIPEIREIGAIGFASDVPFKFRLVRHGQPTELPMPLAPLAEWQNWNPSTRPPSYTTLYPIPGGTRGLNTEGLGVETQALFGDHPYTLFVHARY